MGSMLPDEIFFNQDFSAEAVLLQNIRLNLVDPAVKVTTPANLKFQYDPEISQVYITLFQQNKADSLGEQKKNTF